MKKRIECPRTDAGQPDLTPLYLAGKLSEEEAEAFEAHYLACPTCREDIRAGAALRELYGREAVAASRRPAPARRTWLPLAAAAAIALFAVGVWQAARKEPLVSEEPAVSRSGTGGLNVRLAPATAGGVDADWMAHPGAAGYVARVFARDGSELWRSETRVPRARLDPAIWSSRGGDASLLLEVEALDVRGRVVATSGPIPVPRAPAKSPAGP